MDDSLSEYHAIVEYQRLILSADYTFYNAYLIYKKLYDTDFAATPERRFLYLALYQYYEVMHSHEEIINGYHGLFEQRNLVRDKVSYAMEQERKAALLRAGYGESEIRIIETWTKLPGL